MNRQNKVPIDADFNEMLIFALRYAIGRRTYASYDAASYILRNLERLYPRTLDIMLRDISDAERLLTFGNPSEERHWMELKAAISNRLNCIASQGVRAPKSSRCANHRESES